MVLDVLLYYYSIMVQLKTLLTVVELQNHKTMLKKIANSFLKSFVRCTSATQYVDLLMNQYISSLMMFVINHLSMICIDQLFHLDKNRNIFIFSFSGIYFVFKMKCRRIPSEKQIGGFRNSSSNAHRTVACQMLASYSSDGSQYQLVYRAYVHNQIHGNVAQVQI